MALFLCVSIFRGLNKNEAFLGSKFVAIIFSYIIHTENNHFVGTVIRGSDPPRKPRIGTLRNLSHPRYLKTSQKSEYFRTLPTKLVNYSILPR